MNAQIHLNISVIEEKDESQSDYGAGRGRRIQRVGLTGGVRTKITDLASE